MGIYTNLITDDTLSPSPSGKKMEKADVSPVSQNEDKEKTQTIRKQAHMQANKHVRKQTTKRATVHVTMHASIQQYLAEKATQGFTFRYPPQLLDELEDAIYDIRKRHQQKLPKNAIAVLALAFVIKDYQDKREDSLLYRALLKKDNSFA